MTQVDSQEYQASAALHDILWSTFQRLFPGTSAPAGGCFILGVIVTTVCHGINSRTENGVILSSAVTICL